MKDSTNDALHEKRKHAVQLHRQGVAIMQIVRQSGLSYPSVRKAIDQFQSGGMGAVQSAPRGRQTGSGRSLDPMQEQRIQILLQTRTPVQQGLDHPAWTRAAIAELIHQEFEIRLSVRAVGNYLERWGMSADGGRRREPLRVDGHPHGIDAPAWGPQTRRHGGASQTVAGQTAQRLRRDIITHVFQPGERLTFDKLSRRYQAGSSPVREALFQVAGEGLVLAEDHKGFVVAPINVAEMLDISSLRAEFEAQAMRLSIPRGDNAWEARVLSASYFLRKATARVRDADEDHRSEAAEEWELRHRQLHTSLCSACGSPWLLHFIDILYEHLERYRRYFWDYGTRAAGADKQHEEIAEAALARDVDRVVQLLQSHFQTQAELSLLHPAGPSAPASATEIKP